MAIDERFVFLLQLIARMGNAEGDVAIIGEQKQPGRLPVKSSDRNDPLADVDQVHHRPPATFVARRSDVTRWLVQQNVATLLGS